jgi:hypothetical protein
MIINSGDTTQADIDNLDPGDYYFTMTTFTNNGIESDRSNEFYFQVGQ